MARSGRRFSPDGKQIVTAGDGSAKLWDLDGKELASLEGHRMGSIGRLQS